MLDQWLVLWSCSALNITWSPETNLINTKISLDINNKGPEADKRQFCFITAFETWHQFKGSEDFFNQTKFTADYDYLLFGPNKDKPDFWF